MAWRRWNKIDADQVDKLVPNEWEDEVEDYCFHRMRHHWLSSLVAEKWFKMNQEVGLLIDVNLA